MVDISAFKEIRLAVLNHGVIYNSHITNIIANIIELGHY